MIDTPPDPQHQAAIAAAKDRDDALLAALAHPAGRAWLDRTLAAEFARPSFVPGDAFADAAFREGRKAILREIAERLHRLTTPTRTGA